MGTFETIEKEIQRKLGNDEIDALPVLIKKAKPYALTPKQKAYWQFYHATALHLHNQHKAAITELEKAIKEKLLPKKLHADAYFNLGLSYMQLKQYKKAQSALQKAMDSRQLSEPLMQAAATSMLQVYYNLEKKAHTKKTPAHDDPYLSLWLGRKLLKEKKYQLAYVAFTQHSLQHGKRKPTILPTQTEIFAQIFRHLTMQQKAVVENKQMTPLEKKQSVTAFYALTQKLEHNDAGLCAGCASTNNMGTLLFGKTNWQRIMQEFLQWHDEDMDQSIPKEIQKILGSKTPITRQHFNEMIVHNILLHQHQSHIKTTGPFYDRKKEPIPFFTSEQGKFGHSQKDILLHHIEFTKQGKIYRPQTSVDRKNLSLPQLARYLQPAILQDNLCIIGSTQHATYITTQMDAKHTPTLEHIDSNYHTATVSASADKPFLTAIQKSHPGKTFRIILVHMAPASEKIPTSEAGKILDVLDRRNGALRSTLPKPKNLLACMRADHRIVAYKLLQLSDQDLAQYIHMDFEKKHPATEEQYAYILIQLALGNYGKSDEQTVLHTKLSKILQQPIRDHGAFHHKITYLQQLAHSADTITKQSILGRFDKTLTGSFPTVALSKK